MDNELKEVTRDIIGWEENKIWQTLKDLTIRPGLAVTDYCAGQKQKYLSPITYYFATLAIVFYLSMATGHHDWMIKYSREQFQNAEMTQVFNKEKVTKYNEAMEFVFGETGQKLLVLPLALLFRWLMFRKYNKSFKANAWFSLFTTGHESIVLGPLIVLLWYLTKDFTVLMIFGLAPAFVYDVWSSKQFYKIKLWTSIIRNFLFTIIYLIVIGIVGNLVGVVAMMA